MTSFSTAVRTRRRRHTDFVGCLLDSLADLGVQTVSDIDDRGSLLQNTERFDKGWGKTFGGTADVEILQRPSDDP